MYSIKITPRTFHFQYQDTATRGIYTERKSWMLEMTNDDLPGRKGIGECAPLPELSCDDIPEYEKTLRAVCDRFEQEGAIDYPMMRPYPSMLFGLETALLNLQSGSDILFDNDFSRGKVGITINGLVWMGDYDTMLRRIEETRQQGFPCRDAQIAAMEGAAETDMVKRIRERFSHHEVQLRVDANGGFTFDEALYKLELLAQYAIHSIEQPIKAKQWGYMAELCRESPLPIALDEELIGINIPEMKAHVLNIIKPAYIVLKPSLHGGMKGVREWVDIANRQGIRSWITSALESNVGLNAVAQLAADIYGTSGIMPQGLGTGQLFTDNIPMRLEVKGEKLYIKR